MPKRKVSQTHKGPKGSPQGDAVNQVINQQDYTGNSLPADKRIKAATVPHKGQRQPWGQRDGR
ncbi:MAG: hypothetical protein ABI972_28375 [Acidobacteriota bacterium]